jgi:hypothetical protein
MRTIEGLEWVFKMGTLPTIGEKVWEQLKHKETFDKILKINYDFVNPYNKFSPSISNKNEDLSIQFFEQMDKCGEICYNNFKNI